MHLGIGTSTLASLGRRLPDDRVRHLLTAARDVGVRYIDTADAYGSGGAELAVARALRDMAARGDPWRDVRVVSKVGYRFVRLPGVLEPIGQLSTKVVRRVRTSQRFDTAYLTSAAAASMRRLRGIPLHALCLHNPPAHVLALGDAIGQLASIRARGGSRLVGVSLDSDAALRDAIADERIAFLEIPAALYLTMPSTTISALQHRGVEVAVNQLGALPGGIDRHLEELARAEVAPTVAIIRTRRTSHLEANAVAAGAIDV